MPESGAGCLKTLPFKSRWLAPSGKAWPESPEGFVRGKFIFSLHSLGYISGRTGN